MSREQESTDETATWDDCAPTWDDEPAVRAYAEAAFRSLQGLAAALDVSMAGARICDFGCGTGLLTEKLVESAAAVDAVDSSPAMLRVLEAKIERHGWRHVITATRPPDAGPPYDLIVCSSVCGFLDDYEGTVKLLASRLRPGGLFVQWDWELNPDDEEPMGLSRERVADCLAAAPLEIVKVETAFEVTVEGATMSPLVGVGRRASGGLQETETP